MNFDPTGWLASEKLDGAFCRWTGTAFLSRNGNRFSPPTSWYHGMPDCAMDGELWIKRSSFDQLVSAIQRKRDPWAGVRFMVFDMASPRVAVEARIATLQALRLPDHCGRVEHRLCTGNGHLDALEREIVEGGGEGLCLREPGSIYRPFSFRKVKRLHLDIDRSELDRPR